MTGVSGRILVVSVISAALLVGALAWDQLLVEPRVWAHTPSARLWMALRFVPIPFVWLAHGLMGVFHKPSAERPGFFAVPTGARLRCALTTYALTLWAAIPIFTAHGRQVEPDVSPWFAIVCVGTVAMALTVVAVVVWVRPAVPGPEQGGAG